MFRRAAALVPHDQKLAAHGFPAKGGDSMIAALKKDEVWVADGFLRGLKPQRTYRNPGGLVLDVPHPVFVPWCQPGGT